MFQPVFTVFMPPLLSPPHLPEGEQMWLANLGLQPVPPTDVAFCVSRGKGNVPLPVLSTAPSVNRTCHQQFHSSPLENCVGPIARRLYYNFLLQTRELLSGR